LCATRGLRLHSVEVSGQLGPALSLADAADVEISAGITRTPSAGAPVVLLRNVDGAFVHGCRADAETEVFLEVEGARSQAIVLAGNDLSRAGQPLRARADVPPGAVRVSGD
jgi:hypothetical protein